MWGQPAIEQTCFSNTEIQLEEGVGRWALQGPQAKPMTSEVFRNLHSQWVCTTPYQGSAQHMNCLLSMIVTCCWHLRLNSGLQQSKLQLAQV